MLLLWFAVDVVVEVAVMIGDCCFAPLSMLFLLSLDAPSFLLPTAREKERVMQNTRSRLPHSMPDVGAHRTVWRQCVVVEIILLSTKTRVDRAQMVLTAVVWRRAVFGGGRIEFGGCCCWWW